MDRNRQNYLIFNSNNLIKLSLICFTVILAVRVLIGAPFAFDRGVLLFCGTLLVLALIIANIFISLYVFFRIIVQIFIPKSNINKNDHTSITFFSLFLYALGHLILLCLCYYCSFGTNYIIAIFITLPIFFYLITNLIATVFIFILKIIKKIILFFTDKEDKSNEHKFIFTHFLVGNNHKVFDKKDKYSDKLLLTISMIFLIVFMIYCAGVKIDFIIRKIDCRLSHFILSAVALILAMFHFGLLLFVFIRNIKKIIYFYPKQEKSYLNCRYFNNLLNYMMFVSILFLVINITVFQMHFFKAFVNACWGYPFWGYLLNFIGAIILYMLFYLRGNYQDDRKKKKNN